jgi:hypothetical protein
MSNTSIGGTIVFHDGTTTASNGKEWVVKKNATTLSLSISGTSLDAVLNFEAKNDDDEDWTYVNALNYNTLDLYTSLTLASGLYQIDLTGLKYFRCRVSDITGGDVNVIGRAVN